MALNRYRARRPGHSRVHGIDNSKLASPDHRSKPAYDQYIPPYRKPSADLKNGFHNGSSSGSSSVHNHAATPPSTSPASANGTISHGVFVPKIAKNEIIGTDFKTGVNPHDSQFTQLFMHTATLSGVPFHGEINKRKSFKVTYDPDLDKSLSKDSKKSKPKKFTFFEDAPTASPKDPRKSFSGGLEGYLNKPNKHSKKFPFRQLPQTTFVYDKDSLGPAPLTELVVWDLPTTTSEVYLLNFFKSYGSAIRDLKLLNDPDYGVPLGVASFRFQGSTEKAARLAHSFIAEVKATHMKLDGVELKINLNDHDDCLLNSKIRTAQDRMLKEKQKIEEGERRRQKEAEEAKRRQEQLREAAKPKEQERKESTKELSAPPEIPDSNYTIRSIKHNNRRVSGVFLPNELAKYVKVRPFLLIKDIYIPTKRISSQDIKKALNRYNWTRVLSDKAGFYIVFNDLKECERCFHKEDGKRFYEYRMYMEMSIPEGFNQNAVKEKEQKTLKSNDVVNEATNVLIKEFQMYLTKDIRERVIAPQILELLSDDRYPKLIEELKAKEAIKKASAPTIAAPKPTSSTLSSLASGREQGPLPSFRKKQITKKDGVARSFVKRPIIPMQHALNFDNESEDSEDGESSRSMTPVAPNFKRQLSSAATSVSNDDFDKLLDKGGEPPSKKHKKTKKSFLYESSDEADSTKVEDELTDDMKIDETQPKAEPEEDYSALQEVFQPTIDFPRPVYEEQPLFNQDALDLQSVQDFVKDEEDFELLKEVLKGTEMDTSIKHLDYWAWKKKEASRSGIVSDESDIQGPLLPRLASKTGAFKSDGYKKIPDADKVEYLPHRRKIHKPLKTVQHDEEDNNTGNNSSTTNTNNIQSSRVNRANNRRLAADISAQKQMIGSETDILNLNALTKRKKPVSFARSAIHNWGLYALEPIVAREMIIEYVGESIRQQVAEHREKSYIKTGIGSSYLFRIDENTVIDATKKGGIARFINHCCSPSCTAKIIKVDGKKRIVIYALRDIEANEELTYDYKFERETNDAERIRCLCGAPGCKGYLN